MSALEPEPGPPSQVVWIGAHISMLPGSHVSQTQQASATPLDQLLFILLVVVRESVKVMGKPSGSSLSPTVFKGNVSPMTPHITDKQEVQIAGLNAIQELGASVRISNHWKALEILKNHSHSAILLVWQC